MSLDQCTKSAKGWLIFTREFPLTSQLTGAQPLTIGPARFVSRAGSKFKIRLREKSGNLIHHFMPMPETIQAKPANAMIMPSPTAMFSR
jgi:hypothetical protein